MTPGATKRPSRPTEMATKALKGTGEHRYTEWLFALLGVALLGWDAYLLLKHPPAGLGDQVFHGAWALVALGLIPGAATRAASGPAKIGAALVKAWKESR